MKTPHERDHDHATSSAGDTDRRDNLSPGRRSRSAALDAPEHPIPSGLIRGVQPKLEVGAADDPLEHEADAAAAAIIAGRPVPALSSAANASRAKTASGIIGGATPELERALAMGGGAPLSGMVLAKMESGFGHDLSAVRVHTGDASSEAARSIGAQAFTHGNDIHFAAGTYAPGTDQGDELIAHELAHTIQQSGGVQRRLVQADQTAAPAPATASVQYYVDYNPLPSTKAGSVLPTRSHDTALYIDEFRVLPKPPGKAGTPTTFTGIDLASAGSATIGRLDHPKDARGEVAVVARVGRPPHVKVKVDLATDNPYLEPDDIAKAKAAMKTVESEIAKHVRKLGKVVDPDALRAEVTKFLDAHPELGLFKTEVAVTPTPVELTTTIRPPAQEYTAITKDDSITAYIDVPYEVKTAPQTKKTTVEKGKTTDSGEKVDVTDSKTDKWTSEKVNSVTQTIVTEMKEGVRKMWSEMKQDLSSTTKTTSRSTTLKTAAANETNVAVEVAAATPLPLKIVGLLVKLTPKITAGNKLTLTAGWEKTDGTQDSEVTSKLTELRSGKEKIFETTEARTWSEAVSQRYTEELSSTHSVTVATSTGSSTSEKITSVSEQTQLDVVYVPGVPVLKLTK